MSSEVEEEYVGVGFPIIFSHERIWEFESRVPRQQAVPEASLQITNVLEKHGS